MADEKVNERDGRKRGLEEGRGDKPGRRKVWRRGREFGGR